MQAPTVGAGQMQMSAYDRSHDFQIQLPNGSVMNIPGDNSAAGGITSTASKGMNISEELNRSGVWKNVNTSNALPTVSEKPTCRNNRRRHK